MARQLRHHVPGGWYHIEDVVKAVERVKGEPWSDFTRVLELLGESDG